MKSIDINSDVGEGYAEVEVRIMPLISSCNVACGGHTGDAITMATTIRLAKKQGVQVGAHPSYPDRDNFGRAVMDIPLDKLRASIHAQLIDITKVADAEDILISHVKPHGALYHQAALRADMMTMLCEVVLQTKQAETPPAILGIAGGQTAHIPPGYGIRYVHEGFVDRAYHTPTELCHRSQPHALLSRDEALVQIRTLVEKKQIYTHETKQWCPLHVDSICIHGDTPDAAHMAQIISQTLNESEVAVCAF